MVFRTILACLGKAGYKRKGEAKTQWKNQKQMGAKENLAPNIFIIANITRDFNSLFKQNNS